ncbi:MAG: hypothetical protein WBR29_07980 [Gammaproteobacteria bacterium]
MNTTRKTLIAVTITLNIAAIAVVSGMALQHYTYTQANTIQLGTIVVTPEDVDTRSVNLGVIVVTPSDADWRYAETRGVQRPRQNTIALGSIVVQPTAEQRAEIADAVVTGNAPATGAVTAEDLVSTSLVEGLKSFTPGNYLDAGTALWAFNALVFEHSGS